MSELLWYKYANADVYSANIVILNFNGVSKAMRDCLRFVFLRSVIGPENSSHPPNQSDAKEKQQRLQRSSFFELSLAPCFIYLLSDVDLR